MKRALGERGDHWREDTEELSQDRSQEPIGKNSTD